MSARRDTLVGQNLAASISMSLSVSLVLAVLAKAISVAFGLENTISVADFVVISVIGGFLSSIVVMGITVGGRAARGAAQLGPRQRDARRSSPPRATWSRCPRCSSPPTSSASRGSRRSSRCCARSSALIALVASLRSRLPDPATHRARVAAGARARRHHRRRRRPHHREALRVVPGVPGAARARARRSSRTPARSAAS